MIIGFEDSLHIMMEQREFNISRDKPTPVNRFKRKKITGLILSDTYNNPFFPINHPELRIDRSDMNLPKVRREFRFEYDAPKEFLLPWHFYVEFIQDKYYIFNTRPLDMKFPLNNQEMKDEEVDDETETFLKRSVFDIAELVHVVICGDTYTDIYTRRIYETIGMNLMAPILRLSQLPRTVGQRVFPLGVGDRFDVGLLDTYLRRN